MKEKMLEIRATREKWGKKRARKSRQTLQNVCLLFVTSQRGVTGYYGGRKEIKIAARTATKKPATGSHPAGSREDTIKRGKKENYIPARAAPSSSHWETPSPSGAF